MSRVPCCWASLTDVSSSANHEATVASAAVAHRAGVGVGFCRDGGEEAAAWEDASFEVGEECLAQCAKPSEAGRSLVCYVDHLGSEDVVGGLDRRELEFFFRSEVGEQTALAHPDRVGETTDGESVDAFDGDEACCLAEDCLPASNSVASLPPRWGRPRCRVAHLTS